MTIRSAAASLSTSQRYRLSANRVLPLPAACGDVKGQGRGRGRAGCGRTERASGATGLIRLLRAGQFITHTGSRPLTHLQCSPQPGDKGDASSGPSPPLRSLNLRIQHPLVQHPGRGDAEAEQHPTLRMPHICTPPSSNHGVHQKPLQKPVHTGVDQQLVTAGGSACPTCRKALPAELPDVSVQLRNLVQHHHPQQAHGHSR